MKTHYAKIRQRNTNIKLATAFESTLYSLLPDDELITRDKLVELTKNTPAHKDLDNTLRDLIKRGFVKEIYGLRLDKWLASF